MACLACKCSTQRAPAPRGTRTRPLIAADDLPCMPVLTTAPPPHRYTNEANRDAIREAGAIPLLLGLLDQVR